WQERSTIAWRTCRHEPHRNGGTEKAREVRSCTDHVTDQRIALVHLSLFVFSVSLWFNPFEHSYGNGSARSVRLPSLPSMIARARVPSRGLSCNVPKYSLATSTRSPAFAALLFVPSRHGAFSLMFVVSLSRSASTRATQ